MMHAYLILAHNQPDMVSRLVSKLNHRNVFFFIHIDAKSDITPFHALLKNYKNVQFVRREKVNWMGFSQVQACLNLLQAATESSIQFNYYSLLSGQDYPIKSTEYIQNFLSDGSIEYINYWKLTDRPSWLTKLHYYYLTDLFPIRSFHTTLSLRGIYWRLFNRLKGYFPKRQLSIDAIPYGGSTWWTLTDACVKYILKYIDDHPEFSRFFRHTLAPDELFFQTIIMNSKFAESAQNYQEYQRWSLETSGSDKQAETKMLVEESFNLRYIDWGNTHDERGWPAVLDISDLDALKHSKSLFARKLDLVKSAKLLEEIDLELLRNRELQEKMAHESMSENQL
jgi:Core-2/I-Branching enzyme